MKFSQLFSRTLRDDQKAAELVSHNLMLRAGYIRQLASGIFSYLHFGQRCMRKIEQIIREEMDGIGGDEICMPIVHPAEVWQETGRWYDIDQSMVRFKDRNDRDMVLAMTHEEIVAQLASHEIDTYKQLPKLVYQIYTKFRDEARSRGGLIRVREFTMKDSYSLDTDWEGLQKQYEAHYDAYFRIFGRAGLPAQAILSDTGMMGGRIAHEYMYLSPVGEDTIFICEESGYRANKEVATFRKVAPSETTPLALEKVHTPGTSSIADLAEYLGIEAEQTAKALFFFGTIGEEEKLILAIVRGDMEGNPNKIQKVLGAKGLRIATEEEITAAGGVAGYASAIGLDRDNVHVIVDDLVAKSPNLVAGANEVDYHLVNVCYGRDYEADSIADIVSAFEGALCPISETGATLKSVRGIEIGNIFQLGTKYTAALNATYGDVNGRPQPIVMGSYGIGVGRMLACLVEEHADEQGLKLPISVAPYHVILTGLMDNADSIAAADQLYADLRAAGVEVIYDNRGKKSASPGVKFRDADLIGIPIRLTVAKRALAAGGVEYKLRHADEREIVPLDQVIEKVKVEIDRQFAALAAQVAQSETWPQE